ncbi:hypothetical protein [Litoribaculum gwangyangense]|uniref:Uncharacterized protein n=1 Tax=Litoribaculum gwangyangense TaxID=1130722 RepID=A0ABP9C058_9FLAO
MERRISFFALFILGFTLLSTQCDEDAVMTQDEDKEMLLSLKQDIEALANTSVCNESTECKYIPLGSKPCGGPWSYLVYSTSIDTETLETMVANYNQKEAEYNTKYGIVSDCALVNPPSEIVCGNNSCVAIY